MNDPFAPFRDLLQSFGVSLPNANGTSETPQQKRRRLLQTAKVRAIDQYWSLTGKTTTEMRAAARLAVDRELRNEPLEEFTPQEVNELAEGIRERIYTSIWHRQEKEARRIQEIEERKRAAQRDDARKHTEVTKKKIVFLNEARRRVAAALTTRALSPLQRHHVLEDILTQLDATLTGNEPLFEAYASIDAVLQARVAEWDADEAAKEAKQQEEWWEFGTAVVVVIALVFVCVKAPEILQWLLKIFSPEPAATQESAQNPTTDAPHQASDEQLPQRPVRRIRHPPQSPATEPPTSPSNADRANPFL